MAFVTKSKSGKRIALLNPAEKGRKYSLELKHKKGLTNFGKRKLDKNGYTKRLTKEQLSYRAGYLDARKDSAKAYKSNKKKKRF